MDHSNSKVRVNQTSRSKPPQKAISTHKPNADMSTSGRERSNPTPSVTPDTAIANASGSRKTVNNNRAVSDNDNAYGLDPDTRPIENLHINLSYVQEQSRGSSNKNQERQHRREPPQKKICQSNATSTASEEQ